MALFRLATACAFKDFRHLVHSQVLRSTDLDHRIARARVIQRNADKTRNILHRHKIDRIDAAISVEGMSGSQHLLHSLAGTRKSGAVSEVAAHNLCPLLLQVREAARVSGHDTYRFALREQKLNDNAAETATGPNDQYHSWFLSRAFHSW